jgi:signal transduction histidine kinase
MIYEQMSAQRPDDIMTNHAKLRILMLEDQNDDVYLIERLLTNENFQFDSLCVDTQEEFTAALHSFKPDVILSDHALPQFNSLEALAICQEAGLPTPFILVTGTVSEEFAAMCLLKGADDYILKSNLSRLPSAIRAALQKRQMELLRNQQQEQLQVQNKELVKINRELDAFVYQVSHSLRAPLLSVLGLVHVARLEGSRTTGTWESYCDMIERNIQKLDLTLREILDYSKNARTDVIITQVNLEALVANAIDTMSYLPGQEAMQFMVNLHHEYPVYSDSYRLSVVLTNLISNAIKYQDKRKPNPYIKITSQGTEKEIILELSDNGIGIQPALLPNIFNMFYRATEMSEGSGLGLYIVKDMMDKLEGNIVIDSVYGEGTVVTLTIPNIR